MIAADTSLKLSLLIVSCYSTGLMACKEKLGSTQSGTARVEEFRISKEQRQEDLILLQKTATDALPEGWELREKFTLDGSPTMESLVKSPEVTQYVFEYVAFPTTLMVEEGPRETKFAELSFFSELLFPETHDLNLPARLRYPGKTPPPSIEELVAGKTFVSVREGHMFFRIKVEVSRSAETVDCVIIDPPKPTGLQSTNHSIYPLSKAKPGTYFYGLIDDSMGIDPKQLLKTLVADASAKREAEIKLDGLDRENERNRIGDIHRLRISSITK